MFCNIYLVKKKSYSLVFTLQSGCWWFASLFPNLLANSNQVLCIYCLHNGKVIKCIHSCIDWLCPSHIYCSRGKRKATESSTCLKLFLPHFTGIRNMWTKTPAANHSERTSANSRPQILGQSWSVSQVQHYYQMVRQPQQNDSLNLCKRLFLCFPGGVFPAVARLTVQQQRTQRSFPKVLYHINIEET